ncbi:hypothetical protein K491DRAFT_594887 [Lophiostoma macrostomum CBS 122681]|uniref:Complex 1 LYR protein domain-containing protein n=1 Tax=Lophiostoma macrostomum CBS 122681 TaxID=1314788 RepID=A0A6A6TFX5_9PLEO|nr:hypothetical protein K491DRAFT_594887 [Lophiostoma macrostomum CBS 122681]
MPRFVLPKRSTPHRIAAIALYRALLLRCSSARLPDDHQRSLRNAVRQKFRRNCKIQSPYQLGLAFRAGYETLDHLDAAAAGNSSSAEFIRTGASSLSSGLKRPPPPRRLFPPREPQPELASLPPEQAVLNVRPYTKVSGPRHVPVLCSANGVPFLRLKKPQPPSLSRVLRQKLARKIMRFDVKVLLNNYWIPLSRQEDVWDAIVYQEHGIDSKGGRDPEGRWVDAMESAYADNVRLYEAELATDKALSRNMQGIVDKETALAVSEGQQVVRGRRKGPRKA